MVARFSVDYAIVRIVPRVDREEFVNSGVIVFCPEEDYLGATIEFEAARVVALDPGIDLALLDRHLAAISTICKGGDSAGPIGRLSTRERWHWLVSPRSTVVQTSPAHTALGRAPREALEHLLERVVRLPRT